jgi:hypothetical protein
MKFALRCDIAAPFIAGVLSVSDVDVADASSVLRSDCETLLAAVPAGTLLDGG